MFVKFVTLKYLTGKNDGGVDFGRMFCVVKKSESENISF